MRQRSIIAIAVVAACIVSVAAVTGHQVHAASTAADRLHAEDASPQAMTTVYLRAAEHGDCALTERLTTSDSFAWCAAPGAWLTGAPELVSYRDVGSAAPGTVGRGGRTEVCVPATIDQRALSGAEAGTLRWNWCWVRTADGWRVGDQGQG